MKYSKTCECCGHQDTAYTYTLNEGKVQALSKLVDRYEITRKPVQLGELGISNSQYTNFCHLQYFELAKHIPEGWVPTEEGIKFIHGQIGVKMPVAVMASEVLPDDHEAWETHDKDRAIAFVFDIDQTAYKQRPDYAEERQQNTLFG